mmetsp:Transcript_5802/g.12726  ORF Transcript_5802/g.12726 Transcript_5802/m.12726 type:complete len:290 (-) Transcript_5802:139-1008(-)
MASNDKSERRSDSSSEEEQSGSIGKEVEFKQNSNDDENDIEKESSLDRGDEAKSKEETANPPTKKKRKVHKLSMTQTEDFNAKLKKRGVIYIARIPPKMSPTKIKKLLQEIVQETGAEVTRVYLVEEDPTVRKRRRKDGGNGSKRYIEGWVEISSKKVAKHVALSLNNTPISNQKRNTHFGDLWAVKYLSKFQWSHLTEKVAYERRVKEQKLRLETLQARKETAAYKQLVETGKKLDKIEERLHRKRKKGQNSKPSPSSSRKRSNVKQVTPTDDGATKSTHKSLLGSLV